MQFNSIIDVETRDPNWTKWRTGFYIGAEGTRFEWNVKKNIL